MPNFLCFSVYCPCCVVTAGIMKSTVNLYITIFMLISSYKAVGQRNQRPNIVFILADDLVSIV